MKKMFYDFLEVKSYVWQKDTKKGYKEEENL